MAGEMKAAANREKESGIPEGIPGVVLGGGGATGAGETRLAAAAGPEVVRLPIAVVQGKIGRIPRGRRLHASREKPSTIRRGRP